MLYVIFLYAGGVHDIFFTREECLTAWLELLHVDPENKKRYYWRPVDMSFMITNVRGKRPET